MGLHDKIFFPVGHARVDKFKEGVLFTKDVGKSIKELKDEIDEFRKASFQTHNVDDCDCCEKNLQNIFSILGKVEKVMGKEFLEHRKDAEVKE